MSRALRMLAEAEVRRLLDAGGMLVAAPEAWRAHRRTDARATPAGRVPLRIVTRLQAENAIQEMPDQPGRWTGIAGRQRADALPGPPAHLLAMAAQRPKRVPLVVAVLTHTGLSPVEASRLKAAGQRFLADLEQATTPQRITMRWDGLPSQQRPRFGHLGLMGHQATAALSRLRAVERAIGADGFRWAEALLADRASRRSFSGLYGCSVKEADGAALGCLRKLAEAYSLAVAAPR